MDFPTHQATSDSVAKTANITTDRSWEGPSQEKKDKEGLITRRASETGTGQKSTKEKQQAQQ